ncbi:hypothetical protein GALL_355060 [mine drainage metagenome]|uniref:Uncharacterized protein n=1 Tax=mine drainage metagenome TaxID=410659 RepID=A0A1J5QGY0_9ZZZZ
MPGDCLAFAVLIGGQQQFVRLFEQRFEFGDFPLLIRVHYVERFESVVYIHTLFGPGDLLIFSRDLRGTLRKIANMTNTRLDDVVGT